MRPPLRPARQPRPVSMHWAVCAPWQSSRSAPAQVGYHLVYVLGAGRQTSSMGAARTRHGYICAAAAATLVEAGRRAIRHALFQQISLACGCILLIERPPFAAALLHKALVFEMTLACPGALSAVCCVLCCSLQASPVTMSARLPARESAWRTRGAARESPCQHCLLLLCPWYLSLPGGRAASAPLTTNPSAGRWVCCSLQPLHIVPQCSALEAQGSTAQEGCSG